MLDPAWPPGIERSEIGEAETASRDAKIEREIEDLENILMEYEEEKKVEMEIFKFSNLARSYRKSFPLVPSLQESDKNVFPEIRGKERGRRKSAGGPWTRGPLKFELLPLLVLRVWRYLQFQGCWRSWTWHWANTVKSLRCVEMKLTKERTVFSLIFWFFFFISFTLYLQRILRSIILEP